MSLSLPMNLTAFTSMQTVFVQKIAYVAGVLTSQVAVSVAATSRRRLLAPGVIVNITITSTTNALANAAASNLQNTSALTLALASAGFPPPTILSAAVVSFVTSGSAGPPGTTPLLGAGHRTHDLAWACTSLLLAAATASAAISIAGTS